MAALNMSSSGIGYAPGSDSTTANSAALGLPLASYSGKSNGSLPGGSLGVLPGMSSNGHTNGMGSNGSISDLGDCGILQLGGLGGPTPSSSPATPASLTILVQELPSNFSNQDLQSAFAQFGPMTFCEMKEGTNSGRVGFESAVSAVNAIRTMNGLAVGEKKLHVVGLPY